MIFLVEAPQSYVAPILPNLLINDFVALRKADFEASVETQRLVIGVPAIRSV
jgi:hypothetical protein